jgi:hypothetical protein
MEPHSSLETSPKQTRRSQYFHHLLSGTIALLTIAFPLYITCRYSSGVVISNTAALSASVPSRHSPLQGSEGAN